MNEAPARPPFLSLGLLSAAALASQVLWLRVMSVIQWHHFAFMIISLALLGYGASGTVLTLFGRRPRAFPRVSVAICALLFALTVIPALVVAQSLAFNPEELLWRPELTWRLSLLYLVLGTPFFFAGAAVGTMFMGWGEQAGRVYAADLAGASCGAVLAVVLLWWLPSETALVSVAAVAALAACIAAWRTRGAIPILSGAGVLLLWLTSDPVVNLEMSPYKDLAQAFQVEGVVAEEYRSSPHGEVVVLASPRVPFRDAPGLGLRATAEPPEQRAVFIDGNVATMITRDDGAGDSLAFLDALPSAAPYQVSSGRRVLILGAGGGMLALQARLMGSTRVVAVESNPDVVDLVRGPYADFSGGIYSHGVVSAVTAHPRAFLAANEENWDVIQLPPSGGAAAVAGLMSLTEDYLRTRQAIGLMLDRLSEGGVLALHSQVSLPPKDMLRLAGIAIDALRFRGAGDPASGLLALRSWQWATILVRPSGFTDADANAMWDFAERYGYDVAWHAGMERSSANRINRMSRPWLYDAIASQVRHGEAGLSNEYKFDLSPPTDDRPFFHNFLRWRTIPEILPLIRRGGMPLLEAGYLMLVAALIQAVVLGALLIIMPLAIASSRRAIIRQPAIAVRLIVYFAAIGLAFMFIELAAIHRFILFLGQPVFASATVIGSFLVFAGAGSLASRWGANRYGARAAATLGAVVTVLAGVCWWLLLDGVVQRNVGETIVVRLMVVLAFVGPLAFAMGHLFPTAVSVLAEERPDLVPWAWAINGCASVIGAVCATMISVAAGFDACLAVAMALYILTIFCFPVPRHPFKQPA